MSDPTKTTLYTGSTLISVDRQTTGQFVIKSGTTRIAKNAFDGCEKISAVVIPASVREFEQGAFAHCTGIREVFFDGSVEEWLRCEFDTYTAHPCHARGATIFFDGRILDEIDVPDTVKTIKQFAFVACTNIKKVNIPRSVQVIGTHAFLDCVNLEEVRSEEGLKGIGFHAFNHCTSLKHINLPDGIERIRNNAFIDCPSLRHLFLPRSLVEVGAGIGMACDNLEFYCENGPGLYWNKYWNKTNPKARTATAKTYCNIPRWWYEQNIAASSGI